MRTINQPPSAAWPRGPACLRAPKVPTRCAPRARVSKVPQIGHRARSLPAQIWGPKGGRVRARCPQSTRGHLPPALPATCTARGTCRPCAPRGWWWRRRGAPALFAPRDGPPAALLLTGPTLPYPTLPGPTFWMVCCVTSPLARGLADAKATDMVAAAGSAPERRSCGSSSARSCPAAAAGGRDSGSRGDAGPWTRPGPNARA